LSQETPKTQSGLKKLYKDINDVTIDPATDETPKPQPQSQSQRQLETESQAFDPKAETIDLSKTQKITFDYNPHLITNLRECIAKDPPGPELQALKKKLQWEFQQIMHGSLNALAEQSRAHRENKQFRTDWFNIPEKLMLLVTEIAEAMEAYRKMELKFLGVLQRNLIENKPIILEDDNSLKAHKNFQEELADTLIRLLDLTASLGIDIEAPIAEKMAVNELRPIKHDKNC
jgi:NTP pyrophosphatase (non-canonical NTP hydrolase)